MTLLSRKLLWVLGGFFVLSACAVEPEGSASQQSLEPTEAADESIKALSKEVTSSEAWASVFFDDFDEKELDRTKWQPEVSCWGGGNNERQCYRDSSENIRLENGVLRLIAKEGAHEGPLYPEGFPGAPGGTKSQAYTSGKIRTRGLASFKYGRISAKVKLPEGQGTWPAFWMMPENDAYGNWPLSGEIDIMEAVNIETSCEDCAGGVERRTSGALHFGGVPPKNTYLFLKTGDGAQTGPSEEWRVYSVEWGEGVIQWFVDGEIFMRITSHQWFTEAPEADGRPHAPFDQPFYLMLNLAVGGNLAEKSNNGGFDPNSFPAEMQVDWVRVEQCGEDQTTGLTCLDDQAWAGKPEGPWEVQAR